MEAGNTSLVYQAEIIMGVPSAYACGDKHGPISLIKKRKKVIGIATAASFVGSASWLTKSRRGQRIEYRKRNSEAGCSIPSLASDSSQQSRSLDSPPKTASNKVSFEVLTAN